MTRSREAVLVVGDIMLDRRVEGEMTRISPEAPSPIIKQQSFQEMPGGAANVAANLAAMGRKVYLLGVVGEDYAADKLADMLPRYGINSCLIRRNESRTIVKTKITCQGQQVMRVDEEDTFLGGPRFAQNPQFIDTLNGILSPVSDVGAVVVADYAKGTMNPQTIQHLMHIWSDVPVPRYVDTKPCNAHLYRGAALMKPNLAEAEEMCEGVVHPGLATDAPEEDRVLVMANHILETYELGSVIITRGGNGATYFDPMLNFTSSVKKQEVFDVTGAGDTFMAVLVDSLMSNMPMDAAVLQANTAAAEAVRHHGTTIVSRAQLEEAVKNRLGLYGKILTTDEVIRYAARRRALGQRVVLTNGCFRYLHQGHWELFKWAKLQGDVLIVAVNSDESLRQLRGEVPFIPQTYRSEMLAAIPAIDVVVFFDEQTPSELIKKVNPSILVKGADNRDEFVPGADWVASHGGELRFAPLVEGVHVTNLVQ